MRLHEVTVKDLVIAAQAGDRRAWPQLMARYDDMVHGTARGFRLQDADVDDVAQVVWLHAFEQVATLREPERFGGWLRTIARNESRNVCQRAGREWPTDDVGHAVVEPSPGPEELVLRAEAVLAVQEAVAGLPRHSQLLVDGLFGDEDAGYAGVARTTGRSKNGIGPTRARVLHRLGMRLAGRGFGPAPALTRA